MLLAEQGHPIQDFQNPGGLQQATVTYPDGVTSTDWFLPSTVPNNVQQTPTPTLTPATDQTPQPATALPYCSTFSYAFQPPTAGGIPSSGEWW